MSEHYSVVIVGAGLSGLHSAWQLQQSNLSVLVLEARDRIGGRAFSLNQCDLGPAWVWPTMQLRLNDVLTELNVAVSPQFINGDKFYQSAPHQIERYSDQSSHGHSYRIQGGVATLLKALETKLKPNTIKLKACVSHIVNETLGVKITLANGDNTITADHLILALPPRIWLQNIMFEPTLQAHEIEALKAVPTWMAAQAKIVVVYDTPFWREQNLSGEVMSRCGPLSEITDACSDDESIAALSAFVGLNADQRKEMGEQNLLTACLEQLANIFGDKALKPMLVQFKDWANDDLSCSKLDSTTPSQHPQYAITEKRYSWEGRLILSGSELAVEHGGYLEGAIESSIAAIKPFNI